MRIWKLLVVLMCIHLGSFALSLEDLPPLPESESSPGVDWLVEGVQTEARVYHAPDGKGLVLSNGLLRRTFCLEPNAATVGLDNLVSGEALLRGVKPEAMITVNGIAMAVGGLKGQPNYAFLRSEWLDTLERDPQSLQFSGFSVGAIQERIAWNQVRHHAPDAVWPPKGVHLRMEYETGDAPAGNVPQLGVSIHYELYEGIPLLAKWIEVHNRGAEPVRLERFLSEILAAVEYSSDVEDREGAARAPNLHVETDYAFLAMSAMNAGRHAIRWKPDPDYETQVNYERNNPCLLEVGPEIGPDAIIAPGETFTSFRTFLLSFDGYDRERNGLAQRRMYRITAPWVTENPLMMHVRYSDRKTVETAIDQCAEVGFEMVILTFGSGFDIENTQEAYVKRMQEYSDYARARGIEIGGYSLLASRSINPENDVISPEGVSPAFGHSPCLQSEWGRTYFETLYSFYTQSGFTLLEHDGSYPGDLCASTVHPGHRGLEDSRWTQWKQITEFYHWCRGRGIFLNVPDWYFLSGSNKTGMGYRETNWSLPRDQQVIHTRQNIYDGTWEKTPSMGWMFVPLTEYHGGGAAATIEPLDEHLDHYERMLVGNLALGVQACYRGPRLYDTERTRDMVRKWVDWYKEHRDILESDIIHGRRADGRDLDWMLHVNPKGETKGMLVVFNPLETPIRRTLNVNLYYTGLKTEATIFDAAGTEQTIPLDRDYSVVLPIEVPSQGFAWYGVR